MRSRRDLLRAALLLAAFPLAAPLVGACGADGELSDVPAGTDVAAADVERAPGSAQAVPDAAAAVRGFATDLHRRLAQAPGNLVWSPYSVVVALAMTRNGAAGATAAELDTVLHAPALDRFNAGLNALIRQVDGRAGRQERRDGSKATVELETANSLWGQRDTAWEKPFLEALARDYGAGMRLVDYKGAPEPGRKAINGWTAGRTHGRIPEILPPGVVDRLTRLVLVNAVYLKAPWESPFIPGVTAAAPFRRADGSLVATPTMNQTLPGGVVEADGWRAVRLPYAGGELAMTVVLPAGPDTAAVERSLSAAGLAAMLAPPRADGALVSLALPKWRFRTTSPLEEHLAALGMRAAFDRMTADLSGMTHAERLYVSAVAHQAFIAVDEEGTEAAAATAVVAGAASMPQVVPFVVDRPFLFVVHEVASATPLFIGRVSDPSA